MESLNFASKTTTGNSNYLRLVESSENPSVCEYLRTEKGIQATPNGKCECPECYEISFGVAPEGTHGRCFKCNFTISNWQLRKKVPPIYGVMEKPFQVCRKALIDKTPVATDAWNFFKSRHIHEQVILDCNSIGVATEELFQIGTDLINAEIETLKSTVAAQKQTAEPNGKGRPKKEKKSEEERLLDYYEDVLKKFKKACANVVGWVVFAYRDKNGNIKSLKFRKPHNSNRKDLTWFKPMKDCGVFGFDLPSQEIDCSHKPEESYRIIVEGEFDRLSILSLQRKFLDIANQHTRYLPVIAFGSVNNLDLSLLENLPEHRLVVYDNDSAGRGVLKKFQEHFNFEAASPPDPHKDIDSFISTNVADPLKAWNTFEALLKSRKFYERSFTSVATEIHFCRQKHGKDDLRRQFEVHKEVLILILCDLCERARFYFDESRNEAYLFFRGTKRLVRIERDDTEFVHTLGNFGVFQSETLYQYLTEGLQHAARQTGQRTTVYSLAHYNQHSGILYVFNGNSQVFKLHPEHPIIEKVDNGTDGVLFVKETWFEPVNPDVSKPPETQHLDNLIFDQTNFSTSAELSPEQARLLFRYWVFAIFFREIMQTRPILVFTGEKGSSKTTSFRKTVRAILGSRSDVSSITNETDFDCVVTSRPISVFDNLDGRVDWVCDRLALAATGGILRKRELYKTNNLKEYPIDTFIGLTSRSPRFNRDDVSDRSLILRTERFENFLPESEMLTDISLVRDLIWDEILFTLHEYVRALHIEKDTRFSSALRLGDFGSFIFKINRQTRPEGEAEIASIFEKLKAEQAGFTLQDDPIVDLISIWTNNPDSETTALLGPELFAKLSELAKEHNISFLFKSPRSFCRHLANIRESLSKDFDITEKLEAGDTVSGNKKKNNQKSFFYKKKTKKKSEQSINEVPF